MATTTNYGWTTPDDTALVKDGASAIRTLGSSVDTTTKALNPSTTLGDIEYRSSTANTNTRLGIGTTGQVLAVSGGVPAWTTVSAGAYTLLSTTSLTGATTTISGISGSYVNLFLIISGVTNATADGVFRCAPNASTSITNEMRVNQSNSSPVDFSYTKFDYLYLSNTRNMLRTNANNIFTVNINNYASTTAYKSFSVNGQYRDTGNGTEEVMISGGGIGTNSAITSLVFDHSGGNLSTGTVLLYGVK